MQKMYLDLGCNVQKFLGDVFSLSKHQSREAEPCTYPLEADVWWSLPLLQGAYWITLAYWKSSSGYNWQRRAFLIWFLWNCWAQGAVRVELLETQDNWARESQRASIQSLARKVAGCSWYCINRTDVWQLSQKVSLSPARPSFSKSPCFHTAFVWSHLSHLASEAFWSYQRLSKTFAAWKKPFFIFLKHLLTI